MRKLLRAVACAGAMLACTAAVAQIKVENPWVRGAVPGQLSTGAFLDITSARDATIVKAESPIAATVDNRPKRLYPVPSRESTGQSTSTRRVLHVQ